MAPLRWQPIQAPSPHSSAATCIELGGVWTVWCVTVNKLPSGPAVVKSGFHLSTGKGVELLDGVGTECCNHRSRRYVVILQVTS
jgi:hypothetical protein